jgi:hypothetical protein
MTVEAILAGLGHRNAAVWRGTVKSLRRVVWCAQDPDLGRVLASLVAWLEADTHQAECRCVACLAARKDVE